jgi:PAS domain S-box-containing protein
MKGLLNNPLGFATLVIVTVAVLLPLMALLEYRSNRKNLDRMLYSKGAALMESVLHDAENAVLAEREISDQLTARLADNARYALLLGGKGVSAGNVFAAAAETNGLTRLEVYAGDGSLEGGSDPGSSPRFLPDDLDPGTAEDGPLILLISEPGTDSLSAGDELLAVAVRGEHDRVGVAYAPADQLFALHRRLGIGLILDDLSAVEGVAYAVLQDTLGIIAVSSQVAEISRISEDPFFPLPTGEIRGRYRDFLDEEVYELAARFQMGGESYGYLRVGLSTGEVRSIAELDRKRFAFGMTVLMVLAAVAVALYYFRLRHLRLEQEHTQIKSLSDSVLEAMGEAVMVIDHEGRILLLNHACEKLCKHTTRSYQGCLLSEVAPHLARKLENLELEKPLVLEIELPQAGSPETVPTLVSASLLTISGSCYTTIILRDLTDRKRAEELTLRNEKYKVMSEVSASVAHEIRNPLNAIGMNVQRLKMEFAPAVDNREEYEDFIEIIRREVERINAIVEQYLTLARFPGPKKERAEIGRLLRETLEFFSAELTERRIKWQDDIEPAEPFFFDPAQLRQVFTNLIKNAAEAVEKDGTLVVSGRLLPQDYEISISDNGPGIPESERDNIFEPFFTTKKSGLGLGLAIVQRIVTEHGGRIYLENGDRDGATFVILLPTADKEEDDS